MMQTVLYFLANIGILTYDAGCGTRAECYGPVGPYFTLWGAPLDYVLFMGVGVVTLFAIMFYFVLRWFKVRTVIASMLSLAFIPLTLYISIAIFGVGIVIY
jgi:hypothetical protein